MISGIAIVYEFTSPENRPTYIGLANTIPGVTGSIAPLIGGWLAGSLSYPTVFILSALFGAASLAMLRFAVHEPRAFTQPAIADK
jgi:MFS family permease